MHVVVFIVRFRLCMLSQVQTLAPTLVPPLADMVHNETSAEAEQRLRGVLSSISQRDLVILRQLLPGQIKLTTSSLVQDAAADHLRKFTYQSNVLATTTNKPLEDRVDCERRLKTAISELPKRELHFLRQLVPQFHLQCQSEEDLTSADSGRYPQPRPQPAQCRSRSRSPTLVDRSFASSCGVQCCVPGCSNRCGKVIFALGPPSHVRHYCQDHR